MRVCDGKSLVYGWEDGNAVRAVEARSYSGLYVFEQIVTMFSDD